MSLDDKAFVENLELWIEAAPDDEEKENRQKTAAAILGKGPAAEGDVPDPGADSKPKSKAKPKPVKIYGPDRRGFMRSTLEEGIGEELRQMRSESQGTPFFSALEEGRAATVKDALERLRGVRTPTPVTVPKPSKEEILERLRGKKK